MIKLGETEYSTWNDIEPKLELTPEEMTEIYLKLQLIEKIIEIREEKGVTQKELAEMTGLKQTSV